MNRSFFFLLFNTLNCVFLSAFRYDWQHFIFCWQSLMCLNLFTWKSGSQMAVKTNNVESYSLATTAPSYDNETFLAAFGKLRKATVSFVMSVCPSARPHRTAGLPPNGFSRKIDIRLPKATNIHSEYLLLFHCNDGYTNAPQRFVIRTVHCVSCFLFFLFLLLFLAGSGVPMVSTDVHMQWQRRPDLVPRRNS